MYILYLFPKKFYLQYAFRDLCNGSSNRSRMCLCKGSALLYRFSNNPLSCSSVTLVADQNFCIRLLVWYKLKAYNQKMSIRRLFWWLYRIDKNSNGKLCRHLISNIKTSPGILIEQRVERSLLLILWQSFQKYSAM